MNAVLVFAAHPDDETLGCGGTIARHVEAGDEVHVVVVTDGSSAQYPGDQGTLTRKQGEARAAMKILGVEDLVLGTMPDMRLDTVPSVELARFLTDHVRRVDPHVVYTHHSADINLDHRLVFDATLVATRPTGASRLRTVYAYEVASSTEWGQAHPDRVFRPNSFIDISAVLHRKLRALAAYQTELRPAPHPRSLAVVEAYARAWGPRAGLQAAEAMQLVHERR
jgi:LmbE family N-acetylglucosaminyl deacetylase